MSELEVADILKFERPMASSTIVSIWGEPFISDMDWLFNPYGSAAHVDRQFFDAAIADEAIRRGVHVQLNAKPTRIVRTESNWSIRAEISGWLFDFSSAWIIDAASRNGGKPMKRKLSRTEFTAARSSGRIAHSGNVANRFAAQTNSTDAFTHSLLPTPLIREIKGVSSRFNGHEFKR